MERLTASLTGKEVRQFEQPPTEKERRDVLRRYAWLGSAKTKEIPDESGKDEKREVKVTYDVFLLYSGPDRPAVEQLARRLKLARIELFLDKWNLIPGDFWQEAIEEALLKSAACTVFIGPGDFSPWQHEELRAAIEHRVSGSRGGYRVIPVLLPGASRPGEDGLPRFLQGTTWVQFSRTLDDEEAFHNLVSGIRGLPPGMGRGKGIFEGKCPYRGLAPFGPEHTPFFFGREAQTDWLLGNRLAPMVRSGHVQRFLAILGPSGSGKSSLALAGLVPALRAGKIEGSAAWPIAILRPGDDPFENLTSELSKLKDMADTGEALLARTCEYLQVRDFADDPRALHIFARHALDGAPATRRLVVLVDQFEEVFTQYPAERKPTRRAFIDTLLHAATVVGGPALVLLTMRTDFLGECVSYPALAAALADGQELVGPMSEEELRQAIERPAYLVGCEPELGLAERLLRDVEGRPGALPLLQYTLWELWRRRDGRRLTIAAYREIGGVQGALERRADEVVDNLNDAEREVCRRIFLRLTQPGEGIEDFKRRASFGELVPAGADPMVVEAVIHRLADARLITTEGALKTGGEVSVEVAHEALIRSWGRLREWIDADRAGLRLHRQLAEAAREWKEHAGDASFLFQGTRLAAAREWNEEHRPELNPPELEFLTASLEAERKKADEAEQRVQEARRKQRQQMIVLMGIAVVLLLLAEVAAILVPPTLANRLVEGRLKDLASYAQVVASTVFEELKRLSEPVLEATRARELQKLLKGDDVQRMVEYVKEKVESEQIKYKNFDLRLMSSLNGVSGIPTKGKNLIIVAAVNDVLHFRIFDGDGKVVVDTDEKGLTEQARQIEDLRKQLESLWLPHELTRSDKDRVITAVTQVITAVTQYRPSEDRDLQKMLESEDLRGLQRYTEEYLTKINRGTGKYESIYIEKGGIILAVSPKNQDIIGKDYSERKYYIEAMMRSDKKGMNSVYISPVFRAENDDLFKFAISAPVPDSERPGPPLGVVAVTIASNSALGSNQLRVDLPGISANAGENGPRPVRRPRNPGMLAPKNGRALRVSGDENSKLTAVLVGRWDQSLPRGSARDSQQPKPKPKYLIVIHPAYQHRDNPFEVDLQGFQGFDTKQATNRNYEDPLKNRDEEYAGRMLAASAPVESTELFVIAQQHYNEAIKQSEILAKYLILGGIFLFLGTIIIGAAVVYGGLVGNGTSSPKRLNN
jgi:hypothetical protein